MRLKEGSLSLLFRMLRGKKCHPFVTHFDILCNCDNSNLGKRYETHFNYCSYNSFNLAYGRSYAGPGFCGLFTRIHKLG